MLLLHNIVFMTSKRLDLKIVAKEPEGGQQCNIFYYGDKISLGILGGKIDSNLKFANIYSNSGFTIESLNDCLLKISSALTSNIPNAVNTKYFIRNQLLKGRNVIANADVIILYDLI